MYTKAQKKFSFTLIVFCVLFSCLWYKIFSSTLIHIENIIAMIFFVALVSTVMHWWGIKIAKTGNFRLRSFGNKEKLASCESWKVVQRIVPGITFLLFVVPIAVVWIIKSSF